ncbi:MAG: ribosome maturation factor RimP [Thermodesulfovibrio sp.]|jgi:ribosome maturation factor RimP|uniref:Ribosome maturation factor RimP n=2 Tax=Thermodesulfovibrio TaxID=28261 RepID=A0A2J6WKY6_9BACT|nr:MAG: ribosome maturation factor RimP [Thermodesulfovibrio aggregans]
MNIKELKDKIKEYAEQVSEQEGVEVLDIEIHPGGKGLILRIFIDREGGVTIKDCENFSRAIEAILDIEDPIKSSYTLEVSSPGIDRPLKEKKDFLRNLGRNVKITTKEKIAERTFFIGKIIDAGDDWVRIEIKETKGKGSKKEEKSELLFIPLNKILKAQVYLG